MKDRNKIQNEHETMKDQNEIENEHETVKDQNEIKNEHETVKDQNEIENEHETLKDQNEIKNEHETVKDQNEIKNEHETVKDPSKLMTLVNVISRGCVEKNVSLQKCIDNNRVNETDDKRDESSFLIMTNSEQNMDTKDGVLWKQKVKMIHYHL